jgi:hypothetical protein
LDSPPIVLAEALLEAGWTLADLEAWYVALVEAYLAAGGWHSVPAALPVEDGEWELIVLPARRHGR